MGARIQYRAGRATDPPPPRPILSRKERVELALTAAGVSPAPMLPMYDMTRGTPAERYFFARVLDAGFADLSGDRWPCESRSLSTKGSVFREGSSVVYKTAGDVLVFADLSYGWMHLHVAAPDGALIGPTIAAFREAYPATFITQGDDPRVPITFWADSKIGPTARLRKIEASTWESIIGNYTTGVEVELAGLMSWENGPPAKDGGQLILWQGPPGTGKSWALRALASEWAPWAEFHYITDPDAFFVDNPSYMVDVLLADSYEAIDADSGDVYSEQREGKWRILILEDTGELLSATAKEKYGQGLSRLLNVVDGMIGQGLKVLALVTTNDELGDLHPAVTRPGRCASQIEFGPLSDDEAKRWTGDDTATGGTIAELYARYGRDADAAFEEDDDEEALAAAGGLCAPVDVVYGDDDFIDVPGTDVKIPRKAFEDAVAMAKNAKIEDAIAEVATAHQEDATGYGETAWNAETKTVLYVAGDWTDTEPIETDFLAIDGVDAFVSEAEGIPEGWWDAKVVYPENPPRWVTERPEEQAAKLAAVVELASRPL